jgi:hypothetical protein
MEHVRGFSGTEDRDRSRRLARVAYFRVATVDPTFISADVDAVSRRRTVRHGGNSHRATGSCSTACPMVPIVGYFASSRHWHQGRLHDKVFQQMPKTAGLA